MNDDQAQAQGEAHGGKVVAGVGAVGKEDLQEAVQGLQLGQDEEGSVAILDVGGMNGDREEKPERIDADMALAPVDLLAGVVPADPPFSVVFTLWLSRIAAVGLASRPSCSRTAITRWCRIASHTPSSMNRR